MVEVDRLPPTTDGGFLCNPSDWTEDVAEVLARREDITY